MVALILGVLVLLGIGVWLLKLPPHEVRICASHPVLRNLAFDGWHRLEGRIEGFDVSLSFAGGRTEAGESYDGMSVDVLLDRCPLSLNLSRRDKLSSRSKARLTGEQAFDDRWSGEGVPIERAQHLLTRKDIRAQLDEDRPYGRFDGIYVLDGHVFVRSTGADPGDGEFIMWNVELALMVARAVNRPSVE